MIFGHSKPEPLPEAARMGFRSRLVLEKLGFELRRRYDDELGELPPELHRLAERMNPGGVSGCRAPTATTRPASLWRTERSRPLRLRSPRSPSRLERPGGISELSPGRVDPEETMSGLGGVAGDQLRALVERIEHVEAEIKALAEDKKASTPRPRARASTSR